MRNSACARLITPIMPKITARPRARRMSVAIAYRMPNAVTATKSIVVRAAGSGRPQGGRGRDTRSEDHGEAEGQEDERGDRVQDAKRGDCDKIHRRARRRLWAAPGRAGTRHRR